MKHFDGDLLKRTLKMRKITQRRLSQEICISEKTITNWVRGYGEPSGSVLLDISSFLRVDPNIFMKTEYYMKQPQPPCQKFGKECPNRMPGCHSEKCPHGWKEFENQLAAYRKYNDERMRVESVVVGYEKKRDARIKRVMTGKEKTKI